MSAGRVVAIVNFSVGFRPLSDQTLTRVEEKPREPTWGARATSLALLVAAALATSPGRAASVGRSDGPLARDVTAILKTVMVNAPSLERCQFGEAWNSYPVPASLARRYLGLNLNADVSAASEPITLAQAVDPQDARRSAFCDAAAEAANTRENVDSFERGGTSAMAQLRRWDFSIPVFDRGHRTAIVVVEHSGHDGRVRLADGKVFRKDNEIAIWAEVLRKRGARWRLLTKIMLLMS